MRLCNRLFYTGGFLLFFAFAYLPDYKHNYLQRCGEAGVPPKVVQHWLGHSTLEMTMNVYTHVNAEEEQKQAHKFDTYFDTHSV